MTAYFQEQVLRKRSYLRVEWCITVLHEFYRSEVQTDGRIRFWGYVPDSAVNPSELLLWMTVERYTMLFQTARSQGGKTMKLHYDATTDSLYIDLAAIPSTASREISEDFVVDYDARGQIVGLDIQHASRHMDLSRIETAFLPLPVALAS